MSWSTFSFGDYWAHAHDAQQELFMDLAGAYVAAEPRWHAHSWLREWGRWWLESAGNQGNGSSYLDADRYLTDADRIAVFRQFLDDYRSWVDTERDMVRREHGDPDNAIDFAGTIDAVVRGDVSHPKVNRTVDASGPSATKSSA